MTDAEPHRTTSATGTWGELFGPQYRTAVAVLAGGIALFATNTYLTAAALPDAVADIGGDRFYAWVMTVFLMTSVLSSMVVTRALSRWGARGAYLIAFTLFGIGSVLCAATPTMLLMLVGRAVQGLGGGLLTGLAFTVIRLALPSRLWVKGVGLTSAMWGVGNLIGPVLGGFFAQIGIWRGSFWLLVVVTVVIAALAVRALPSRGEETEVVDGLPVGALAMVLAATVAVSVAGSVDDTAWIVGLAVVAVLGLVGFVVVDRRGDDGLLPRLTYRTGSPLKWIYISIAVLAVGSTSEAFIPLFGQQIAGMGPLVAGMLGAALSWGWSFAQILSTTWASGRSALTVRVLGPAVLGTGLAGYGLLQTSVSTPTLVAWFVLLFIAGAGIGMAYPHIATAAMSITDDPAEAARASAGVNTVQMVANAFGMSVAGLLVSVGPVAGVFGDGPVASARMLTLGFALLTWLGVLAAVASVRGGRASERR